MVLIIVRTELPAHHHHFTLNQKNFKVFSLNAVLRAFAVTDWTQTEDRNWRTIDNLTGREGRSWSDAGNCGQVEQTTLRAGPDSHTHTFNVAAAVWVITHIFLRRWREADGGAITLWLTAALQSQPVTRARRSRDKKGRKGWDSCIKAMAFGHSDTVSMMRPCLMAWEEKWWSVLSQAAENSLVHRWN